MIGGNKKNDDTMTDDDMTKTETEDQGMAGGMSEATEDVTDESTVEDLDDEAEDTTA